MAGGCVWVRVGWGVMRSIWGRASWGIKVLWGLSVETIALTGQWSGTSELITTRPTTFLYTQLILTSAHFQVVLTSVRSQLSLISVQVLDQNSVPWPLSSCPALLDHCPAPAIHDHPSPQRSLTSGQFLDHYPADQRSLTSGQFLDLYPADQLSLTSVQPRAITPGHQVQCVLKTLLPNTVNSGKPQPPGPHPPPHSPPPPPSPPQGRAMSLCVGSTQDDYSKGRVEVRKLRRRSRGEVAREGAMKCHFSRIGSDKEVGVMRIGQVR